MIVRGIEGLRKKVKPLAEDTRTLKKEEAALTIFACRHWQSRREC